MAPALNPFRLFSELIVFLLGALLILLAMCGRIGLPARPAALIVLGLAFIYWGVRTSMRPESGARPYEARIRAASLVLVGLMVLSMLLLPLRFAPLMLGAAGAVLVLRGLLGAIFALRKR